MPGIFRKNDSTDGLPRFSEPASACPTSKLTTHVKQVKRLELNTAEGSLLNGMFGGFLTGITPAGDVSRSLAEFSAQHGFDFEYENRIPRRYDGDQTLPSGRYSTLCSSTAGDDDGTLVHEMQFYADPAAAAGHVEIYDPAIPDHRGMLDAMGMDRGAGERVVVRHVPFAQASANVPWGIGLSVPIVVQEVSIEGVLDLRRPVAAEWLARTISSLAFEAGGKSFRCFANRADLPGFREMLPALMDQAKGGGNLHKIIGLFLRQLGVSGLVFPSARCDARVEFDADAQTGDRGWSFVNYRNCPPARIVAFFEMRPHWPTALVIEGGDDNVPSLAAFARDVTLTARGYDTGRGALLVEGLEKRLRAHYFARSAEAAARFRLPAVTAAEIQGLIALFVSQAPEDAANLAAMVLFSLLGMRQAQDDLRGLVADQLGSHPVARLLSQCANPPPVSAERLAQARLPFAMR